MMPDHYATLGVEPTASAAAIRTAYLRLMREYHPDRNPSPEAVTRAQAAIAAFKVLSDFDDRNHYDWDRRREREAAETLAAQRPRSRRAGLLAVAAIGLAAASSWQLLPTQPPQSSGPAEPRVAEPGVAEPGVAEPRPSPVTKARPATLPKRVAMAPRPKVKVEKRELVAQVGSRSSPVRKATAEPMKSRPAVERAKMARVAAAKAPQPALPASPPPRTIRTVPKPAAPAPTRTTDLASLDHFVMNFYGQTWRHGDAPKRAALIASRANFLARSGSCAADACKRAAYLKLMRDVSEIVETGQPPAR